MKLVHRTRYSFARPVRLGPHWLRLRPRPDPRRPTPGFSLRIAPEPQSLHWQTDAFENTVARFTLPDTTAFLEIEASIEPDLTPRNPFDFLLDPEALSVPFRYDERTADALLAYRRPDHPGPLLAAMRMDTPGQQETVGLLTALAARVLARVDYIVREEAGVWPPDRTLSEGRGSCRDSAWVLVQLLRLHGIAARFVSGYLVQPPTPGSTEGPGARGSELHAWAEAFLPGAGWIGIDATSGYLTAESHVALAASPEPEGAAPVTGTREPAETRLDASISLV